MSNLSTTAAQPMMESNKPSHRMNKNLAKRIFRHAAELVLTENDFACVAISQARRVLTDGYYDVSCLERQFFYTLFMKDPEPLHCNPGVFGERWDAQNQEARVLALLFCIECL